MNDLPSIAVLGGTGSQGSALARRWALAGYKVIIGSRDAEKAKEAARKHDLPNLTGADNLTAAQEADLSVLTVPSMAQVETLEEVKPALNGKILIDATVPLVPPSVTRVTLPPEGSAALRAEKVLGMGSRVVSAFQNIAAEHIMDPEKEVDCDVLVCGNYGQDREKVVGLINAIGLRAWEAGALANSVAAESLTSILISINIRYRIAGAGIRITGGEPDSTPDEG